MSTIHAESDRSSYPSFLKSLDKDWAPLRRITQEERIKAGALGKRYVYDDKRITIIYLMNTQCDEIVGSVYFKYVKNKTLNTKQVETTNNVLVIII